MFYKEGSNLYFIDNLNIWHFIADIKDTVLDTNHYKGEIELADPPNITLLKEVSDDIETALNNIESDMENLRYLKKEVDLTLNQ